MSVTVSMPQLGETVTEGTILRWAKQVGDSIAEDEILLEISTDKVDTEVPSPAAGTILEILVPEGATVEVGTAMVVIGAAGEQPASAAPEEQAAVPASAPEPIPDPVPTFDAPAPAGVPVWAPEPAPVPAPVPTFEAPASAPVPTAPIPAPEPVPVTAAAVAAAATDVGPLSPVVRKLASEHDVDLSMVPGTGRNGRITRKDVETFVRAVIEAPPAPIAEAPAVEQPPAAIEPAAVIEPVPVPVVVPAPVVETPAIPIAPAAEPVAPAAEPEPAGVPTSAPLRPAAAAAASAATGEIIGGVPVRLGDTVIELDRLRLRIAENMIRAKQTAAHVWTSVEVDFEAVEQVRSAHKEAFKAREGFSLTYMPFIARATIDALLAYPVVNSTFHLEEGKRIQYGAVNLGIAVDMNQAGLVVMNIPGADGVRMTELARRVRGVADKARSGNLAPDDLAGTSFTITNPGPFGSLMSAPIINIPNVAILSTDTIAKRPVVVTDDRGNDAIAIRHIGYLGLTWDHRAFDGSTAVLVATFTRSPSLPALRS